MNANTNEKKASVPGVMMADVKENNVAANEQQRPTSNPENQRNRDQTLVTKQTMEDVKENDVLCGRGGATNNHPGNRRFRELVSRHQTSYLASKKCDKKWIARSIVEVIRQRGGRFLKRQDGDGHGHWYEIGDKKASEKTSQALREGLDVRAKRADHRQQPNADDISSGESAEEALQHANKRRKKAGHTAEIQAAGANTSELSSSLPPPLSLHNPVLMNPPLPLTGEGANPTADQLPNTTPNLDPVSTAKLDPALNIVPV